ncbi:uncharacterized protein LOC126844695 [Adelges cooleyi]|uniref:uncharacterized protein LOC126844695 n=1 Tax=Adelges cooleyi TaxID=133065 RepID=UPI00217FDC00|nr:uncharacterized protein LOC126844695 [Adelges cooleyi]
MFLLKIIVMLFSVTYCFVLLEAEDWLDSRYRETIFNEQFVLRINVFKTVDCVSGNGPVELNPIDQTRLLEQCKGQEDCIQRKEISIEKYKTKMEALQCINGVIVHYLLNEITAESSGDNPCKYNNVYRCYKLIVFMSRMLATLYRGQTFAHKWLWTLYTRLLTANNWPYAWLADDNLEEYSQHQNDLLNYIGMCQENRYLPTTTVRPSAAKSFYDSIVAMDIDVYIERLYGLQYDELLSAIYDYAYLFEIDYIVLADYFHRDSDVFGSFRRATINWGSAKVRLKSIRSTLTSLYPTDEWRRNPFIFTEYHDQIMRIMKSKTYYHTWLHLTIFETILSRAEKHVDGEFSLNISNRSAWDRMCYHTSVAAREFQNEDIVFYSVVHHLCTDIEVFDRKFLWQVRSMADSLKEIISNDFSAIGVGDDEIRSNFDVTSRLSGEPETRETICQDLILLGADENDVYITLYGVGDVPQTPQSDEGWTTDDSTILDSQSDDLDKDEDCVQRDSQSDQQLTHEFILNNEYELFRYVNNFMRKIWSLEYFYILFFSSGKHDLNTTFFRQNRYTTQY